MAFVNRIRLPLKLTRPQFLEERDIFRKANGEIKVLNAVVRKQYEGETDLLPEKLHQRIMIALAHTNVAIEGEKYIGNIAKDGDYTIAWVDFLDYPIAKATFKAFATPFDVTNSNCGQCVDVIQVVANDDNAGDVNEGDTIQVAVLENDDICCYPVTLSIITTNSDYVQSISIIDDAILEITLKTPLSSQNNVLLASYRAQCTNGQFDEANVYANVTGTGDPVCQTPINLSVNSITSTEAEVDWDDVVGASIYNWKLYLATDLITPVQTGSVFLSSTPLAGLTPSTQYVFFVNTQCAVDNVSGYGQIGFTTNPVEETETCGNYIVCFNDPMSPSNSIGQCYYLDCNGDYQLTYINNFQCKNICALQSGPGSPVFIDPGDLAMTVEYVGLC